MNKVINVEDDIWTKLQRMKLDRKLKSINEVIKEILNRDNQERKP